MLILRCTRKLLERAGTSAPAEPPAPTAPLGEWYVNRVRVPFRGQGVVMYTNAATLLTVLAPGRELRTTLPAFQRRLPALMARLGLSAACVDQHRRAAAEVWTGPTASRHLLGSMNDFGRAIWFHGMAVRTFDRFDLDVMELRLAETPMRVDGEYVFVEERIAKVLESA